MSQKSKEMDVDHIESADSTDKRNEANTGSSNNNKNLTSSSNTTNGTNSTKSSPMSNKSKAELREKLKQLATSNRKIVIDGCGDWRCTNPYCKSNETNQHKTYTESQASKLALKMIKDKHKACKSFTRREVAPLRVELVNKLSSIDDVDSEQYKAIHQQILEAFTHWDILYESFLTESKVSDEDIAVNFLELDRTFDAIMKQDELCKDVRQRLTSSMNAYLNKLKEHDEHRKLGLDELRSLIILMECPVVLSEDIDCHDLVSVLLAIFAEIDHIDFKSIKVFHQWFSKYPDLSRLKRILHSLHQYMTLVITMQEDEIEDLTDEWKVELKYDDTDDNDERDELQQEIDRKQQMQREKYIKEKISKVIKLIDIIYIANKIITNEFKLNESKEEEEEEKKEEAKIMMDVDCEHHNDENNDANHAATEPLQTRRVSLVGIDSVKLVIRQPLELHLFHNDGLNEAICSKEESRSHIHRRDFLHYRDRDFFTFLSYPYLLTAASKARYLEFENLMRQHRARRRRMFDLMLGGGIGILNNFNRNQLIEELDLVLRIRRGHLIQDTLGMLQLQEPSDLRKRLRIVFDGEQGIDQGGLTKEYFQLIMKELFDPNYGMFIYNAQTANFWFNRDCFELADTHTMLTNFELVGQLTGIAIYNNTILDLRFPRVIFKKLLQNEPINFKDFRDYDPEMAKGFEQLLAFEETHDVTVEDVYCRNFIIKWKNIFGQEKEYDLLNGHGKDTMLNKKNRKLYVDLYIKYVLVESIEQQFNAFLKGFKTVCDSELFGKYTPEELELLICGSKEFDFEALETATRYEDGFHKDSKIVRDFWNVAHELSDPDKRRLLTFCTGSDRVPINGLGEISLTISKNGNDNSKLPTSHTCFNHLLLPEYSSKEILKRRLLTAIQNSEGFGLL